MTEVELFKILKEYLLSEEFDLRAEVNDIDVVGIKNDEIYIYELKKTLNMDLLIQCSDRLRYTKNVYACIPSSSIKLYKRKGKKKLELLKNLGIGLILINVNDNTIRVKQEPKLRDFTRYRKVNQKKINKLLEEFYGRKELSNEGGSVKTTINTAYKEKCIEIADFIGNKEKSLKEIREYFNDDKVNSILSKNFYGWFIRTRRGYYKVSDTYLKLE